MRSRPIPKAIAATLATLSFAAIVQPAEAATPCDRLTALRIPDLRVVRTSEVRPDPVWMAPLAQPPGGTSAPKCRQSSGHAPRQ